MIPYGRQLISEEDIRAVVNVLRSDFITQGPAVECFESALATRFKVDHAVAVNSATSALIIACQALGLGGGDVLWTSPNSYVASANCALLCGADVDFVDIDTDTHNMCVLALADKLRDAELIGRLPKVVMPVHFGGWPCDMAEIHALSKRYGFYIIEDASHAVGAMYQGSPIGSCEYSDITVFSFHPVKIITTGEGGSALTNSHELAEKMMRLRSHGVTREKRAMRGPSEGAWYYQQLDLGYNFRMTEMQAALGLSQLDRLETFIVKRRQLARDYQSLLESFPMSLPHHESLLEKCNLQASHHLYPIVLDQTLDRKLIFDSLREQGVGVNVHYIPIHLHPYYESKGFERGGYPRAEHYYRGAISLPLHPGITEQMQLDIVACLKKAMVSVNHA